MLVAKTIEGARHADFYELQCNALRSSIIATSCGLVFYYWAIINMKSVHCVMAHCNNYRLKCLTLSFVQFPNDAKR